MKNQSYTQELLKRIYGLRPLPNRFDIWALLNDEERHAILTYWNFGNHIDKRLIPTTYGPTAAISAK